MMMTGWSNHQHQKSQKNSRKSKNINCEDDTSKTNAAVMNMNQDEESK